MFAWADAGRTSPEAFRLLPAHLSLTTTNSSDAGCRNSSRAKASSWSAVPDPQWKRPAAYRPCIPMSVCWTPACPTGRGIEVCRDVRSVDPSLNCIILTSFDDEQALRGAVLAGARGYVLKEIGGTDLIGALRRAAKGESLFEEGVAAGMIDSLVEAEEVDPRTSSLTPQERRVLELVGGGLTNRQIAAEMFLAEKTVKNYVSSLLAKLGFERRTQAARLHRQPGLPGGVRGSTATGAGRTVSARGSQLARGPPCAADSDAGPTIPGWCRTSGGLVMMHTPSSIRALSSRLIRPLRFSGSANPEPLSADDHRHLALDHGDRNRNRVRPGVPDCVAEPFGNHRHHVVGLVRMCTASTGPVMIRRGQTAWSSPNSW